MEDLDFFFDGGVVDRRILKTVAEGFIVDQDFRARRNRDVASEIPVVNQFVCGHS
jgi:hypothetical protein